MKFDFYLPTRLLTGEGCVLANSHRLRELGTRCLIVTGRHSARACGALEDVTRALEQEGIGWTLYDKIGQNPLLTDCKEAGDLARREGASFVVGIGGGSPLDAAKAAAVFAANKLEPLDLYRLDWSRPALPLVLVGTTAGTGSEVGPVAVLTKPDGHKQSVSREDLMPGIALGDPRYTASLPLDFTVSTALDALCHALEGYFSLASNPLSDLLAVEAAVLICRELPLLRGVSAADGIPRSTREQLYFASILAGFTLTHCGTCYVHTLSYYLTEEHGVPHGAACAALLPDFLERQAALLPQKAQDLLCRVGLKLDALCGLIRSLLADLSHIHMLPEEIHRVAAAGATTKNFQRTAPAGYTAAEAEALLSRLFG